MSVFVEPLRGKQQPLGIVFVSYCRRDAEDVGSIIVKNFDARGIPYFLDAVDLKPGDDFLDKIEQGLWQASCGVIVLSEESVRSNWIWFESGLIAGRNKPVIPFLLQPSKRNEILGALPEFLKRFQIADDLESLLAAVRQHVFEFENVYDDPALNERVLRSLRRAKVTITLDVAQRIADQMDFNYLLVRFGREDVVSHPLNEPLLREASVLNRPFRAQAVKYDTQAGTLKIDYILPIHPKLGIKFKPFVDVESMQYVLEVMNALKDNGFENVSRSSSAEKQRIYFLLPAADVKIVKGPDGILDNFLYPV